MARKLKSDPQSRAPLRWGEAVKNTMTGRYHWRPGGAHSTPSQKKGLGKRERPWTRC